MTYAEFTAQVQAVSTIRLRNYTWTEANLTAMIDYVYRDLMNEIHLEWEDQDIVIDKAVKEYDVTNANNSGLFDAFDSEKFSIWPFLSLDDDENTVHIINEEFLDFYDGQTITITRKHMPAIADANPRTLDKILKAIIEGIVYFIQDSIPSQADTQAANFHYQRYFNERKMLINLNPQMKSPGQTNTQFIDYLRRRDN